MRFGTVPQSPIPFLKPGYVKTKRQDKLRRKAFPCFFIGSLANRPHDTYEVLLNSGSIVHSRNVTWARLPPSVPVSAENVHSVSVSRKGGKLDPSRHREVEFDEGGDCEEPSGSTGVRPRATTRLVTPTPAAVPRGRAAPPGGRGTAAATSLRGAAMREIPGTPGIAARVLRGVLLCLYYKSLERVIDINHKYWNHAKLKGDKSVITPFDIRNGVILTLEG